METSPKLFHIKKTQNQHTLCLKNNQTWKKTMGQLHKKCCNCKSPLKVKPKKKQQQKKKRERKVASFPIYFHLVLGKRKDLNHYF